jgi:hypothetical protein
MFCPSVAVWLVYRLALDIEVLAEHVHLPLYGPYVTVNPNRSQLTLQFSCGNLSLPGDAPQQLQGK